MLVDSRPRSLVNSETRHEADVHEALAELDRTADVSNRAPSVLALARHLGIPNTTLRRRFPDICVELATARRQRSVARPAPNENTPSDSDKHEALLAANARLRPANQRLADHLELAIANIQRLTLENHELRQALQEARNVIPLQTRHDRRPTR
jgi:hypothetical protein